jgi:hypothetical protein
VKFEALASMLANMIWERFSYPLQQELFDELGPETLLTMKRNTRLLAEKKWPKDVMSVVLNVGSEPPNNRTKPSPTPRKPKKAANKGK